METIKEIIAEMREFADTDSQSIGRDVLRRRIQHFADRIERATNCNQQKMRKALLMVKKLFDGQIMFQHDIRKAHKAVNDALEAPAFYETEKEAYQAYHKEMEGIPAEKEVTL